MSKVELLQGDCLEKMKDMPDESVDAVVCDPPYFLSDKNILDTKEIMNKEKIRATGFMDKEWDGGNIEVVEIYDVPKELL